MKRLKNTAFFVGLAVVMEVSSALAGGIVGGATGRTSGGQSAGGANKQVVQACTPDARKFCGSVINDAAARKACMQQHAAALSENCKQARRSIGL